MLLSLSEHLFMCAHLTFSKTTTVKPDTYFYYKQLTFQSPKCYHKTPQKKKTDKKLKYLKYMSLYPFGMQQHLGDNEIDNLSRSWSNSVAQAHAYMPLLKVRLHGWVFPFVRMKEDIN